jgi:hypothetical protein
MTKQFLLGGALVLAVATLTAQAPKPATAAKKPAPAATKPAPQPQKTQNRYVPAIMQEKMITLSGCLKHDPDWELTDATVAGQKDKATYKLEGISAARLSLFVGKRIDATGALQDEGTPARGRSLPRFEATAVQEATGNCS